MKREYDFSKAVRGKFYHKNARLRLSSYLDGKIHARLQWSIKWFKEIELLEELT